MSKKKGKTSSKRKTSLVEKYLKTCKKKLKKMGTTGIIKAFAPYVIFGYFGNKVSLAYRLAEENEFIIRLMNGLANINAAFKSVLPSFHWKDLCIGILAGVAFRLVVYYKIKNAKKYRTGVEYGSARWGTEKDIEPFVDWEDPDNNIILTKTESLRMAGRPDNPVYERNKNVLVIGGSGSGKTRFFVKPNIMQLHSSYVITDPKGTIIEEVGTMLKKAGYVIKVINTIDFKKSMHFNPMIYIKNEEDLLRFVNALLINTKGEGTQSGDDFWQKAEKLLYQAYIGYMFYECVEEERNFSTLLDMIDASETREDDENYKNAIDLMFEELEERDPEHFAVRQYKKYKLAAGVINYKRFLIQSYERQPMAA